jgi:predicted neutral ceramidase superfamily lipid hydrolase
MLVLLAKFVSKRIRRALEEHSVLNLTVWTQQQVRLVQVMGRDVVELLACHVLRTLSVLMIPLITAIQAEAIGIVPEFVDAA